MEDKSKNAKIQIIGIPEKRSISKKNEHKETLE
jgi:hypothetical protein